MASSVVVVAPAATATRSTPDAAKLFDLVKADAVVQRSEIIVIIVIIVQQRQHNN
jgi:hypothetical protein